MHCPIESVPPLAEPLMRLFTIMRRQTMTVSPNGALLVTVMRRLIEPTPAKPIRVRFDMDDTDG